MSTAWENLYYKRAVATEKPCYICLRPTTIVLATIGMVDFLYTCESHLTDRGFATEINVSESLSKSAISQEEIDQIKKEWEEKQAKAKEKEKEKAKEEGKDDAEGKEKEKEGEDEASSSKTTKDKGPTSPPTSPPPVASHKKFVLHRDIFSMRLDEHRRRRQAKQVKEIAPKLPAVPQGSISLDP